MTFWINCSYGTFKSISVNFLFLFQITNFTKDKWILLYQKLRKQIIAAGELGQPSHRYSTSLLIGYITAYFKNYSNKISSSRLLQLRNYPFGFRSWLIVGHFLRIFNFFITSYRIMYFYSSINFFFMYALHFTLFLLHFSF